MAFGGFENKHGRTPMAEMNMVPLIDVMLVLLVIFIVTAPLLSHSVRIELPQASSKSIETTPAKIDLAIQSDGELLYNGNAVDRNTAQALFMEAARKKPMPEVHIYADRHANYQYVAQTLSDASRAGLTNLSVLSPDHKKNKPFPLNKEQKQMKKFYKLGIGLASATLCLAPLAQAQQDEKYSETTHAVAEDRKTGKNRLTKWEPLR